MPVLARRREREHDLVVLAVDRPEVSLAHLPGLLHAGLDRRLVHRQDAALQNVRRLRRRHRRQQVDGAPRPVRQARPAHRDPRVRHPPVLAVQRQVVAELVDQHPRQQAHVRRRPLQHVRRRPRRQQHPRVPALHHRPHVPQHLVARRTLRQPVRDLLADHHPLRLGDRLHRRIPHLDGGHRHRVVEAQARLVHRVAAGLPPPPVADLLGGNLGRRHVPGAERLEQARLFRQVDLQALLGTPAEQLALEPVELVLQRRRSARRDCPPSASPAARPEARSPGAAPRSLRRSAMAFRGVLVEVQTTPDGGPHAARR